MWPKAVYLTLFVCSWRIREKKKKQIPTGRPPPPSSREKQARWRMGTAGCRPRRRRPSEPRGPGRQRPAGRPIRSHGRARRDKVAKDQSQPDAAARRLIWSHGQARGATDGCGFLRGASFSLKSLRPGCPRTAGRRVRRERCRDQRSQGGEGREQPRKGAVRPAHSSLLYVTNLIQSLAIPRRNRSAGIR